MVSRAAWREVFHVLKEALDCDGFKHRELPYFADKYDETDDYFFACVDGIIATIERKGKKR